MYMDETILASLIVVGGTLAFFVGLGIVIVKDIRNKKN